MPFRHAHWYVLGLFPLAGLAFWPQYLSQFGKAPAEFHAHGITASLWLLLLAAQGWSIHHGQRRWHRAVGLSSFALFPLFLAGGASIFIGMAQRYVEAGTPFYQLYPARLAWLDIGGVGGIAYFYFQAMRQRRNVAAHSGYLLATAIFLLPPILGRLSPILPGLSIEGPADFAKLMIGFQLANGVTALIAVIIGLRSRNGRPFFEAAGLVIGSGILFQTVGGWPAWEAAYSSVADIPTRPMMLAAAIGGMVVALAGWTAGRRSGRQTAPA